MNNFPLLRSSSAESRLFPLYSVGLLAFVLSGLLLFSSCRRGDIRGGDDSRRSSEGGPPDIQAEGGPRKFAPPKPVAAQIPPLPPDLKPKEKPESSRIPIEPSFIKTGEFHMRGAVARYRLLRSVDPIYPADALADKVQGTVRLNVRIGKDGKIVHAEVTSSPDERLSEAALHAVRQWEYEAFRANGVLLDVLTDVEVTFESPNKPR